VWLSLTLRTVAALADAGPELRKQLRVTVFGAWSPEDEIRQANEREPAWPFGNVPNGQVLRPLASATSRSRAQQATVLCQDG
jgi:hypothetical protein